MNTIETENLASARKAITAVFPCGSTLPAASTVTAYSLSVGVSAACAFRPHFSLPVSAVGDSGEQTRGQSDDSSGSG